MTTALCGRRLLALYMETEVPDSLARQIHVAAAAHGTRTLHDAACLLACSLPNLTAPPVRSREEITQNGGNAVSPHRDRGLPCLSGELATHTPRPRPRPPPGGCSADASGRRRRRVCCLLSVVCFVEAPGNQGCCQKKKKRTRQANRERGRRSRSDVIDGEVRQGCACGPNMPSPSSIA